MEVIQAAAELQTVCQKERWRTWLGKGDPRNLGWRAKICGTIIGHDLFRMSTDKPELSEARAAHLARWEAVEVAKAQELASISEERAQEIIQSLGAVQGWRERPDWSGLVEQQAIFQRGRGK